ncbi:hypothetical protein [Bradyrhizobium diazoefficiens]|uniref:hypothetical protein n=1 Tax=Bradyrhizobium diazoefficiens TaxID=1355477 RepID=UPI00272C5617|nr:hypothetical protein [Bradyrhizobium diazoefficiens]WLA62366.1 hypothetical protein QNN01_28285 [Bradyrhizobium diazoefficiens]
MATLRMSMLTGLFRPSADSKTGGDYRRARVLVEKAHKKSGGPTAELKRVYGAYLDNERRRKEQQSGD